MQTHERDTALAPERLIPVAEICAAFNCTPQSLERYLGRFGVSMTVLSRSKRGLLATDYQKLLARARVKPEAA